MNIIPALFIATSLQLDLPQGLLESICYVETKHTVTAVHYDDGPSDSLGICQLKLTTARLEGFKGTERQLMNPATNIYYSGKYLHHQLTRYNDLQKAVIAYNQGSAKQLTTSNYQVKVFKQWRMYANNKRARTKKYFR